MQKATLFVHALTIFPCIFRGLLALVAVQISLLSQSVCVSQKQWLFALGAEDVCCVGQSSAQAATYRAAAATIRA